MAESIWYYEEAGQQAGPVSQAALAEAIQGRRLPAGSRVWRAGLAGWLPWEAVPELAALAPAPPVGPPPLTPAPAPAPAWGPPPGSTAPFPPDSYAADVLSTGAAALYPKAPLGARLLAFLLDGLIASVPLLVAGLATVVAIGAEATGLAVLFGVVAAAGFGWALWYGFTKDGRANGQSIGKGAMGLMVVHLPTNLPCTSGQSALRYLVLVGLDLIPYVGWLVEPIVTLSSAGGRRLGDRAAATQVIAAGAYRPRR